MAKTVTNIYVTKFFDEKFQEKIMKSSTGSESETNIYWETGRHLLTFSTLVQSV